jgi:hypothetical protein
VGASIRQIMMSRSNRRCARVAALSWLYAAALLLVAAPPLAAQEPAPAAPPPPAQSPDVPPATPRAAPSFPAQPPPATPGVLQEIGRWWQDSVTNFNAGMKDAQGRIDDYNAQAAQQAAAATQEAMKNAADAAIAVVRLPNTRVIEARERCAAAANGAPDCRAAATAVCRGKGFQTGQALDIQSAQKCPASAWLSGRVPGPGDCPLETTVTRAVCQ